MAHRSPLESDTALVVDGLRKTDSYGDDTGWLAISPEMLHDLVVLFLDETTLGGDAQTRQTPREFIYQLNEDESGRNR